MFEAMDLVLLLPKSLVTVVWGNQDLLCQHNLKMPKKC